jgi:hypothetical protein
VCITDVHFKSLLKSTVLHTKKKITNFSLICGSQGKKQGHTSRKGTVREVEGEGKRGRHEKGKNSRGCDYDQGTPLYVCMDGCVIMKPLTLYNSIQSNSSRLFLPENQSKTLIGTNTYI